MDKMVTDIIGEIYNIKQLMNKHNFWSTFMCNTAFPDLEYHEDERYLYSDVTKYNEDDAFTIIKKTYEDHKDYLLLFLSRKQYAFLTGNVKLFHNVNAFDNTTIITVI